MIEKKIYDGWAFSKNEREKGSMNNEIYEELRSKYKVTQYFNKDRDNLDDFDVALSRKPGYNHSVYSVIKNSPNLSRLELALIADGGNLCFGFTNEYNGDLHVFED